jgi:hypothetical protein
MNKQEVLGRERKWGGSERQEFIYPVLKVPRQCLFVSLVEVMRIIGINFHGVFKVAV